MYNVYTSCTLISATFSILYFWQAAVTAVFIKLNAWSSWAKRKLTRSHSTAYSLRHWSQNACIVDTCKSSSICKPPILAALSLPTISWCRFLKSATLCLLYRRHRTLSPCRLWLGSTRDFRIIFSSIICTFALVVLPAPAVATHSLAIGSEASISILSFAVSKPIERTLSREAAEGIPGVFVAIAAISDKLLESILSGVLVLYILSLLIYPQSSIKSKSRLAICWTATFIRLRSAEECQETLSQSHDWYECRDPCHSGWSKRRCKTVPQAYGIEW